jgi:hypothetical protein
VLREKEGFSANDKVVVISDVLADQPTEAIQIRSILAEPALGKTDL